MDDRTDEDIKAWSDMLWYLWQNGFAMYPEADGPQLSSREAGYAVQALLEERGENPLFGWKIAATSRAGQQHINVSGPMAGRLLAERVHEDGATIDLIGNRMRVAEPEFAFRFDRDLEPRDTEWTAADVLDAVDTLHLALEIPDSRFFEFDTAGEAKLIADNACAHQLVLGPPAQADWRALDLSAHKVRATFRDGDERHGSGANVLGDPREALAWLVNEVNGMGITIKAGQTVITGTCMVPLELKPGDNGYADFGILGTIGINLTGEPLIDRDEWGVDDIPGHFDWALQRSGELMYKDGSEPFALDNPFRTVLLVNGSQGVIDNGGLDYFYEQHHEFAEIQAVIDAYREIGANAAADRLAASLQCFPPDTKDPESRMEFVSMRRLSGDKLDQLSNEICGDGMVWRKLNAYIADHFEAFSYD